MHYQRWYRHGDPLWEREPKLCSVEGCAREYMAKGLCGLHYGRVRKGDVARPQCSVEGCNEVSYSKGLCPLHYRRLWAHGDPLTLLVSTSPEEALERYTVPGENGCILWIGAKTPRGYGVWTASTGIKVPAHRMSYEVHVGAIPPRRFLNHKCWVPACVNPGHLEPVTQAENMAYRSGPNSNSQSGFRNVYLKSPGRWYAQVSPGGRKFSGPIRYSVEEAVADAEELRRTHFGKFAGRG